jgi:hypothetical protein
MQENVKRSNVISKRQPERGALEHVSAITPSASSNADVK